MSEDIVEAQAKMMAARERLKAHDDRLARTEITAPVSGQILALKVNTIGGVIEPGQTLMTIVPADGTMEAVLRIAPADRDAIAQGQEVEAQLSAYKQYRVPRISGEVVGISADLLEDEKQGTAYYEARVLLDLSSLKNGEGVRLLPGMPIDGFVASGRTRTLLDYALEPVVSTFRRGSRMS